jgi:hypothetical protein
MNRPTNADLRAAQFRLVSMGRVRNHRSAGESWTRLDLKVWIRRADSRPSFGAEVSNAVRTSSTASVYSNASQESDAVPVNGGTVIGKADMVMVMKLDDDGMVKERDDDGGRKGKAEGEERLMRFRKRTELVGYS